MILGLYGEDKTCKTTLALTAPKPLRHMEFDLGGFNRAALRFNGDIKSGLIQSKKYIMPMQALFEPQDVSPDKVTIKSSRQLLVGFKELWYSEFLVDYYNYLKDPEVKTIVLDTFTMVWELCHKMVLQEKQEVQIAALGGKPMPPGFQLRDKLLQIEYGDPGGRMRQLLYIAVAQDKNLVLTHHARDQYKKQLVGDKVEDIPTGKRERAGWGNLGDIADVIVHTYIVPEKPATGSGKPKLVPCCEIELSSISLNSVGLQLREPSWDSLGKLAKMVEGVVE